MIKGMEPQERQLLRRRSCSDGSAISRPAGPRDRRPNSSNFDLIREAPDYLLHFKKEGMDELFAKEKAMLEGLSEVRGGAWHLHLHDLHDQQEGRPSDRRRNSFAHPEFKLVREAQLFPYEDSIPPSIMP
jgi:hypothetical protein